MRRGIKIFGFGSDVFFEWSLVDFVTFRHKKIAWMGEFRFRNDFREQLSFSSSRIIHIAEWNITLMVSP